MNGGPLHKRPVHREMSSAPAPKPDLVESAQFTAFTTVMPDGFSQASVVWCDFDGTFVQVSTMRGFRDERRRAVDRR